MEKVVQERRLIIVIVLTKAHNRYLFSLTSEIDSYANAAAIGKAVNDALLSVSDYGLCATDVVANVSFS